MSNLPPQTWKLTPEQFQAAKTALQQQYKVSFEGNTWVSPEHWDTHIELAYDGESNLVVQAIGPFAKQGMERVETLLAAVCSPSS